MSRRKSNGDIVVQGETFIKRQGRSFELCDNIPQPNDTLLRLHKIGDYEHFADANHIARVIDFLGTVGSEYAFTSGVYFALDENLKQKKEVNPIISKFDLPKKFRRYAVATVMSENPKSGYNDKDLNSRVHYLVASIRSSNNYASEFAAFDFETNSFHAVDNVLVDSMLQLKRVLQVAKEKQQLVVIPFESFSLQSSHMCTMIVEPKVRNNAVVHIFDPNGEIPSKEPDFPYCKSYKLAVASSVQVLFRFIEVFDHVTVNFRKIPNFNIPGAAPRNSITYGDVDKKFLVHKLDREINGLLYHRESDGICVIVSLFVITQAICFGKRVLQDRFWEEAFRIMSGRPLETGGVVGRVDRNKKVFGGKEVLHQVYTRLIFMRSLAWAIYSKALSKKALSLLGGNTDLVYYDTQTGNIIPHTNIRK